MTLSKFVDYIILDETKLDVLMSLVLGRGRLFGKSELVLDQSLVQRKLILDKKNKNFHFIYDRKINFYFFFCKFTTKKMVNKGNN